MKVKVIREDKRVVHRLENLERGDVVELDSRIYMITSDTSGELVTLLDMEKKGVVTTQLPSTVVILRDANLLVDTTDEFTNNFKTKVLTHIVKDTELRYVNPGTAFRLAELDDEEDTITYYLYCELTKKLGSPMIFCKCVNLTTFEIEELKPSTVVVPLESNIHLTERSFV